MSRLFAGTRFDRPPMCERCGQPEEQCVCPPVPPPVPERLPPHRQTAVLSIEKRKRGKSVTVVRGLDPDAGHLSELLTQLKTACGAGGSLQEGAIEIQGKQLDRIRGELTRMGYQVKG